MAISLDFARDDGNARFASPSRLSSLIYREFMMKSQAWAFVAPFFLFMAFLVVESWFPNQHYVLYPFKTLLVGTAIVWFWRALPSLTPGAPVLSVLVGVAGVVLWIGLDPWLVRYAQPLIGRNPFQLYPTGEAWGLFSFRLLGIALVVPVMEELLWRGFLMRWVCY